MKATVCSQSTRTFFKNSRSHTAAFPAHSPRTVSASTDTVLLLYSFSFYMGINCIENYLSSSSAYWLAEQDIFMHFVLPNLTHKIKQLKYALHVGRLI
jgi:hypothetical protein